MGGRGQQVQTEASLLFLPEQALPQYLLQVGHSLQSDIFNQSLSLSGTMCHTTSTTSTTQYNIPYDRNLYLTVTSPDHSPASQQEDNTEPPRLNTSCQESDSVISKNKLQKESTESDEQKSSSSADQPKSTSSEPKLGSRQLQRHRNTRNDHFEGIQMKPRMRKMAVRK